MKQGNAMYRSLLRASSAVALLLLSITAGANGPVEPVQGSRCTTLSAEQPLETRTGSAGIMYNLAEHPKSIRAVAAKLLANALDGGEEAQGAACGPGCQPSPSPEVVYRVTPKVFLPDAKQAPMCVDLETRTKRDPMRFPAQEFKSVDALNAWVMEFTQGRGELGKQLYDQCGGNCSPRYEFQIAQGQDGLKVETAVICGLARDTASDDYEVSTAVRRRCDLPPAKR